MAGRKDEVRKILRDAVKAEKTPAPGLGSRIAGRFARIGLTEDLPLLRSQAARTVDFRK